MKYTLEGALLLVRLFGYAEGDAAVAEDHGNTQAAERLVAESDNAYDELCAYLHDAFKERGTWEPIK